MKQEDNSRKYFTTRIILWVTVLLVTTYVTYNMSINCNGLYPSDYPAHISSALNHHGYSLMSVIMKLLYGLAGNTVLIAVLIGFLVAATGEALLYLLNQMDQTGIHAVLISYSLVFIASLYIPEVNPFWYVWGGEKIIINSFTTQPWHNSTYIGMRLFAVYSFAIFLKCYKKVLNNESNAIKDLILLFVLLCITNMFKPNYIIAFVPAMVIVCLVKVLQNHGSNWKEWVKLQIPSILSLFPLIIEYKILFPSDGNGGWTISLEKFGVYISHYGSIFIVLTSLLFPIAVTVTIHIYANNVYLGNIITFGWMLEIVTVAESMLLAETGPRAEHGNFTWGIYCSSLILFTLCCGALLTMIREKRHGILLELSIVILMLNFANGFMYFGNIFTGQSYLC